MSKRIWTVLGVVALMTLGMGGITGCDSDDGSAEKAGEEIDEALEEAGDKLEELGDD